ncbi:MAG: alpha/beta hydrolase [Hyphomicrobiales bacterium]
MASEQLQVVLNLLKQNRPPEGAPAPDIAAMRAGMEERSARCADDISVEPVDAGGVPAEWISAPNAEPANVVLYLHGGGYVLGSPTTHRDLAARISRASGARVLLIDYRLAPEHPFPAAVDDALAAYRWILAQGIDPAAVAIAGDSAGGGLTLATLLALRDAGGPLPASAACISPWTDLTGTSKALETRAHLDPMVQREGLLQMAASYLGGADPKTPLASPLFGDPTGLPDLLIQVGTSETLFDDGARFAARACEAGVAVTFEPWQDMIHVWHAFAPILPEGQAAIERMGEFIRARLRQPATA